MMSIFAQALKILHESDLHHKDREIARAAQLYVEWSLFMQLWTDWLTAETGQLRLLNEAMKRSAEAVDAFNRAYETIQERDRNETGVRDDE